MQKQFICPFFCVRPGLHYFKKAKKVPFFIFSEYNSTSVSIESVLLCNGKVQGLLERFLRIKNLFSIIIPSDRLTVVVCLNTEAIWLDSF